MPTLEFQTTVPASIDRVWAWHQDIQHLPRLSPPQMGVRIESAPSPLAEGSQVVLAMKGPFGRSLRWVIRIVQMRPPHDVIFGREARFIDEQVDGPFRHWRHEHDFEHVAEQSTQIRDRITYALPLGPLGWLIDAVYLRRRIRAAYRHRHEVLDATFPPL